MTTEIFVENEKIDINKEYYISPITKDTGLHILHKLCLFPEKLKEYIFKDDAKKVDINCKTTLGWTPLIIACRNGVTESVKLLLQHLNIIWFLMVKDQNKLHKEFIIIQSMIG